MTSEEFLTGDRSDEVFEIERFEVRHVFEPFFVVGGFREGGHGHGGGEGRGEGGVRRGDGFAALEGAVADEEDGAFGELGGEAVTIDNDGLRFRQLAAVGGENGGVDFHAAGVHHRHNVFAAFGDDAEAVRFLHQHVQGAGGEEGESCAEAQALGGGNTHAEARVGPRSLAHANGIQVLDGQAFFVDDFLDEGGGEGRLHPRLVAGAGSRDDTVLREGGGKLGGGSLNQKNSCHGAML